MGNTLMRDPRASDLAFYLGILIFVGLVVLYRGLTDDSECDPYAQIGIKPYSCMEQYK